MRLSRLPRRRRVGSGDRRLRWPPSLRPCCSRGSRQRPHTAPPRTTVAIDPRRASRPRPRSRWVRSAMTSPVPSLRDLVRRRSSRPPSSRRHSPLRRAPSPKRPWRRRSADERQPAAAEPAGMRREIVLMPARSAGAESVDAQAGPAASRPPCAGVPPGLPCARAPGTAGGGPVPTRSLRGDRGGGGVPPRPSSLQPSQSRRLGVHGRKRKNLPSGDTDRDGRGQLTRHEGFLVSLGFRAGPGRRL